MCYFKFMLNILHTCTKTTGALSALADRIKIARKGVGDDINLSIQYVLNCGSGVAGSCWGGSHSGAYEFAKTQGFIPYDTCQPYLACSSDSGKFLLFGFGCLETFSLDLTFIITFL